jgi:hypothetical protein
VTFAVRSLSSMGGVCGNSSQFVIVALIKILAVVGDATRQDLRFASTRDRTTILLKAFQHITCGTMILKISRTVMSLNESPQKCVEMFITTRISIRGYQVMHHSSL